jgi:hypothetical protein
MQVFRSNNRERFAGVPMSDCDVDVRADARRVFGDTLRKELGAV